ncbi:tetratricopeptide repeat protein [Allosphingosinicella flava]|uniref:Tetratricopeptide repeat protein n=1 Tax=Allosphingosinicella flava TaxID=2771430 RepID=A0A7T2GHR3_9SPHN|nr:tetratricopeptide repeat protein [Sphingosinicella flava]QPQ54079.1 tetratricopeptide repeat protein [Sphingosinicella flava]
MAIKPADNEAFYREVDDELRRAQLTTFWQRYGKALIAGFALLLAAIGGYLYWQHRQEQEEAAHAEMLTQAFSDLQANKLKEAGPRLDQLAKEGSDGYRAAALLTKADIALSEGKDAEAAAQFKAVADNADFAAPYRELALLRQTAAEFDKLPPAQVIERLKGLAVAGNPWFGSAGEMVAIAHMKAGKPELAGPIFAAMAKDDQLPDTIRSRAVQMASSLGIDAVPDSDQSGGAATEKAKQ